MATTTLWAALAAAVLAVPVTAQTARAHPTTQPPPGAHATAASGTARSATAKPRSDRWERRVLELTNKRRHAHGVKPLKAGTCPDHFAETWTRHMARTGDFEHQSLSPFFKRCHGILTAGENIAYGYESPRALVSGWMHSEGHRENILNPAFHRIGVSGWRSPSGTTYATQDFVG